MAKAKRLKVRNTTARAAWERGGAGVHQTSKKEATKARGAKNSRSIGEQFER